MTQTTKVTRKLGLPPDVTGLDRINGLENTYIWLTRAYPGDGIEKLSIEVTEGRKFEYAHARRFSIEPIWRQDSGEIVHSLDSELFWQFVLKNQNLIEDYWMGTLTDTEIIDTKIVKVSKSSVGVF